VKCKKMHYGKRLGKRLLKIKKEMQTRGNGGEKFRGPSKVPIAVAEPLTKGVPDTRVFQKRLLKGKKHSQKGTWGGESKGGQRGVGRRGWPWNGRLSKPRKDSGQQGQTHRGKHPTSGPTKKRYTKRRPVVKS